jgi:hypothetical protein
MTFNALKEMVPWVNDRTNIFVEEIRPLPDLSAQGTLSAEDARFLEDLREALELQRDIYTSTIQQINERLLYQEEQARPVWGSLPLGDVIRAPRPPHDTEEEDE